MNIVTSNNTIAIKSGTDEISFMQLHELILKTETKIKDKKMSLIVLYVSNILEDISIILAALKSGTPIALIENVQTPSEKNKRIELLPESYLWNEDRIITTSTKMKLYKETRVVLFTSGSSGEPKAVQLSEKNIQANTQAVIEALDFHLMKEQHLFLPLSYSFGLLGQLVPALVLGKPTVLYEDFTAFFRACMSGNVTGMISGVPSHHEAILKITRQPNHVITHIISAGAKLSVDLRKRLIDSFPNAIVYNNYGQTEASPRILSYKSSDPKFLEDYVGRAVGQWVLRITSEGELQASGPQVMLGYIDSYKDTKAIIDGWLSTGDRGEITSDGLVKILGRMDDLIKVSGERISIGDLETTYKRTLLHDDLAVYSIEDHLRGSIIVLVYGGADTTEKEIRAKLEKECSRNRLPHKVEFRDVIPKLPNGKVDRVAVKSKS